MFSWVLGSLIMLDIFGILLMSKSELQAMVIRFLPSPVWYRVVRHRADSCPTCYICRCTFHRTTGVLQFWLDCKWQLHNNIAPSKGMQGFKRMKNGLVWRQCCQLPVARWETWSTKLFLLHLPLERLARPSTVCLIEDTRESMTSIDGVLM